MIISKLVQFNDRNLRCPVTSQERHEAIAMDKYDDSPFFPYKSSLG